MSAVYAELHRLAAGYLRQERPDHTLQATALVHEAYLQLRKLDKVEWTSRAHFVGVAARTMRRILVDHARRHVAQKRGGADRGRHAGFAEPLTPGPDLNIVSLDDALDRFAQEFPRQAQVVELRFFGGLTSEETAEVLTADSPITARTVERDWRFARAWLHRAITGAEAS
jgi:RNA polymerase sigma factor (TIGR02999 family)